MSGFENVVQQIIFTALNGNLGAGVSVYDSPPSLPEGVPDSGFPYVVIGNDTHQPWDTDDTVGSQSTITLHFWSRAEGFNEVKGIMGTAYGVLHRATLTKVGYHIVDCLWEFSETMSDPDGVTKHGVQRYLVTLQA